jgi:hypothetical protein
MLNLGYIYYLRGKYDGAEKLLVECVQKRSKLFGEYHCDTMQSLALLVQLYESQGKHAERGQWLEQYQKGNIVQQTLI